MKSKTEREEMNVIIGMLMLVSFVEADVGIAECTFTATAANAVVGRVVITQLSDRVSVVGGIKGLADGNHGFHVHAIGDIYGDNKVANCTAAGAHYNPLNTLHGAPNATVRHAGDWGNIASTGSEANFNFTDSVVKLAEIMGRAIVVHADPDDYGLGNFSDSKTTGHAGARLACCQIATTPTTGPGNISPPPTGVLFGLPLEIVLGVLGGAVVIAAIAGVAVRYAYRAYSKRRAEKFQKL